jgi:hypothetical protein
MKIVEEDVTTYQECLGSYLKKIFQRSMQRLWNADERTLLHPSNPPDPKHPQKKHSICKTVTTIPPPARGAATSKHPQLSVLPWNQGKKKQLPPQPGAPCPGPAGFSKRLGESDTSPLCPQGAPHTGTRRHRPGLAKNRDTRISSRKAIPNQPLVGGINIQKNIHQPSILG